MRSLISRRERKFFVQTFTDFTTLKRPRHEQSNHHKQVLEIWKWWESMEADLIATIILQ